MRDLNGYIIILLIGLVFLQKESRAQENTYLTPEAFIRQVAANHPVARQSGLLTEFAAMQVREARGAFDPALYGELDQKFYADKTYWNIADGGLKLPTRLGLEFKAAYERSSGDFLNNQFILPEQGLAYVGVSIPVLRGLFTDDSRTGLQLSLIGREIAEQEKRIALNDLFFRALKAYVYWAMAAEQVVIREEGLAAAQFRMESVRNGYLAGDLAAIDTVEASLQVRLRAAERVDAEQEFVQSSLNLRNYLWTEDGSALEPAPETLPVPTGELMDELPQLPDSLLNGLTQVRATHPELLSQLGKMEQVERKRKLAVENLKPKLNVQYNFITEPTGLPDPESSVQGFNSEDYKLGVQFAMPLFLRKERGKLQQVKIEQEQVQLEYDRKQLEIQNAYSNFLNALELALVQVELQSNLSTSYRMMWEAEQEKFRMGESSLFLVNARESSWIDARIKLNKAQAELIEAWSALIWATGGNEWQQLLK